MKDSGSFRTCLILVKRELAPSSNLGKFSPHLLCCLLPHDRHTPSHTETHLTRTRSRTSLRVLKAGHPSLNPVGRKGPLGVLMPLKRFVRCQICAPNTHNHFLLQLELVPSRSARFEPWLPEHPTRTLIASESSPSLEPGGSRP